MTTGRHGTDTLVFGMVACAAIGYAYGKKRNSVRIISIGEIGEETTGGEV